MKDIIFNLTRHNLAWKNVRRNGTRQHTKLFYGIYGFKRKPNDDDGGGCGVLFSIIFSNAHKSLRSNG